MRARLAELMQAGRRRWGQFALSAAALASVAAVAAVSHGETSVGVLKLRMGGDAHRTRVIIELDRGTRGRMLPVKGSGPQLELALAKVGVPGLMQGEGGGLIRSWSVSEGRGGAVVHLDLVRPAAVMRRFLLAPGDGMPAYRYVLDLTADQAPAARQDAALPLQPGRKVVVIDAGHGGKDPGAGGVSLREKDVTLAAARLLRDKLEQTGRYHVVLTRDGDSYVPLTERVQVARRANADLFISLHADSDQDHSIRGATVYTLSDKGTHRVAEQMFEQPDWFIDMDLPGQDQSVKKILLDLTQRETKDRSAGFAQVLLQHIGDRVELLHRSHRAAGFVVLLAPDVPAVLLEMGFITNRQDEGELADPAHRQRLVDGVASAIDSYFGGRSKVAAR